ncbi:MULTISPECIES: MFS transporter [Clostridia]|uniref:MFS transporter n=1 Tax=Clostridia TaxID=186801 RepID=UPI00067EE3F5|nr:MULTISPECIES: MFS transporter [Clostridia]
MSKTRKIGAVDYIAYACSALVYILPQYLLSSFLSAYYTDVALVSAGVVGSVVLLMRFTDGISDLLIGGLIDRTNTRLGKARPWILTGTIGVTLTMFLIFHAPGSLSISGKVVWLAVTYFLLMVVFATMEGVANSTLMVYLTNDTQERNKFGASNMAGTYIGGLVATTLTSVLLVSFGYTQFGYDITIILYSVLVLVLGIFATVRLKERNIPKAANRNQKKSGSMKTVVYSIFHNKYYLFAVAAGLLINLINGITTGLGVYFCRDIFGNAGLYTLVTLAVLLPTLIGLPAAVALAKKIGHHKILVYGRVGYMIGLIVAAFGLITTNVPTYFAGQIIAGLCGSAFAACFQARVANICDYGEYKFKTNATGVMMSATSFCNKAGLGIGAAITGMILEIAKYDGALAAAGAVQSAYTIAVERYTVAFVPLFINFIVLICLYCCNVDPQMDEIRAE